MFCLEILASLSKVIASNTPAFGDNCNEPAIFSLSKTDQLKKSYMDFLFYFSREVTNHPQLSLKKIQPQQYSQFCDVLREIVNDLEITSSNENLTGETSTMKKGSLDNSEASKIGVDSTISSDNTSENTSNSMILDTGMGLRSSSKRKNSVDQNPTVSKTMKLNSNSLMESSNGELSFSKIRDEFLKINPTVKLNFSSIVPLYTKFLLDRILTFYEKKLDEFLGDSRSFLKTCFEIIEYSIRQVHKYNDSDNRALLIVHTEIILAMKKLPLFLDVPEEYCKVLFGKQDVSRFGGQQPMVSSNNLCLGITKIFESFGSYDGDVNTLPTHLKPEFDQKLKEVIFDVESAIKNEDGLGEFLETNKKAMKEFTQGNGELELSILFDFDGKCYNLRRHKKGSYFGELAIDRVKLGLNDPKYVSEIFKIFEVEHLYCQKKLSTIYVLKEHLDVVIYPIENKGKDMSTVSTYQLDFTSWDEHNIKKMMVDVISTLQYFHDSSVFCPKLFCSNIYGSLVPENGKKVFKFKLDSFSCHPTGFNPLQENDINIRLSKSRVYENLYELFNIVYSLPKIPETSKDVMASAFNEIILILKGSKTMKGIFDKILSHKYLTSPEESSAIASGSSTHN